MIMVKELGQVHVTLKVVEQVKTSHIGKIQMEYAEAVNKIAHYVKRWKTRINLYARNVKLHLY